MPLKGVRITDALSAWVDLKDETTGAKIASVELAGPEHPKRKAILFARQRKVRNVLQRTGKLELADPQDEEQDDLEMLVQCTLAWSAEFVDDDGKALACTAENVRKEFGAEGNGWLRRQLKRAADETERFIKSSALN